MNSPTLATGAVVATLLARRRDWVRSHDESVELRGDGSARRRVSVEFELPAIVWGAVASGAPILVPVGTRSKTAGSIVDAYDEDGERVAVLPDGWSAEIAASGLLSFSCAAGVTADDHLTGLIHAVVSGPPAEAGVALTEMSFGESDGARWAWMHAPFRSAAQLLAERHIVLLVIGDADRPRTLTYTYEETLTPLPTPDGGGLKANVSRHLGWDGLQLRLELPDLHDSGRGALEVRAGETEPQVEIEKRGPATIHLTLAPVRSVLWAPVAALIAALLLTTGCVAAPSLRDEPSSWLPLLGLSAALSGLLASWPESVVPTELLRGLRGLLWLVTSSSLADLALLAGGASPAALRGGFGVLAALAWVVAVLLLATYRRAAGSRAPSGSG